MTQKLSFVIGVTVVLVLVISTSCFKSTSAEKDNVELQRPEVVVDHHPIKSSSERSVFVKNPDYSSNEFENHRGHDKGEEADEIVDVETDTQSNGGMRLTFTSHGRKHTLELKESKALADISVNIIGSSEEFNNEVKRKMKDIKMMKDPKRGALLAMEKTNEQTKPRIKRGVFQLGKHQFEMSGDSLNRTKVSKQLVKDTPPNSGDSVSFELPTRRKRAVPVEVTPVSATVELAMIVDYSIWSHMSSGDVTALNQSDHMINLLLYYAHMADIMNGYYKTMLNDDVHINVVLAGIVVITKDTYLTDLTEVHQVNGSVDSSETLQGLARWVDTTEASNTLPRNDHVMLFTRYDLYDKKSGKYDRVGLANIGTICEKRLSVSLVEVSKVLSGVAGVAAHELGHSLGGGHDEKDNGCADKNYIMAANVDSTMHLANSFLFSCCAQRSFYATITDVGGCLMDGVADSDLDPSIDTNVETYLPGQIFSADDQCYIAEGTKACNDSIYTKENTSICLNLYCVSASNNRTCDPTLTAAADGTDCDVGKWCIQSQCVDKNQTYSLPDQNCDVRSCYGDESQCLNGVNTASRNMFRCYSDDVYCDGGADCLDGTDEKDCNKTFTCPPGYTKCHFGKNNSPWVLPDGVPKYCIHNSWVCDGLTYGCSDNENKRCSKCYTCQEKNVCVNNEEDCEKECPDDKDCIDGVRTLYVYSGVVRVVHNYTCMTVLMLMFLCVL